MSLETLTRTETADTAKAVAYPRDRSVHEIFEAQAALRPRARAAVDHGRSLTYGQLAQQSDALAARLVAAGVQAGDTVGVCGKRCLEALVAF